MRRRMLVTPACPRPWSAARTLAVAFTLALALFLAGAAGTTSTALAAKRVALMPATAADSADAPVRARISKALKQHKIQVVAPAQVTKAVKKSGPPSSDDDWVNLARKLRADGFVLVDTAKKGAKRRVEIVVRSGADGATTGQATFLAKGPPKRLAAAVAGGFWKKLGPALKKTAPPAKAEHGSGLAARDLTPSDDTGLAGSQPFAANTPAPSAAGEAETKAKTTTTTQADPDAGSGGAEAEDKDEDKDEATGSSDADSAPAGRESSRPLRSIEVELDLRLLRRLFAYVPVSAARYYFLSFVPLIGGSASWYPVEYAGVFARGEFTNLLKTGIYPTATRELVIGAQGRFPISIGQIGGSVAYFQHMFVIRDTVAANDTPRATLPTPDTNYQGVRVALNGRLRLGQHVRLGAEGAYRLVTNPGQGQHLIRSPDYFPNATVSVGIDGAAFVAIGILDKLEVRAGVDYRRYVFGALRGTNINATAATDDYLAFSLGAVGVFGGK